MSTVLLNLRTDYLRAEIHHIDVSLIHGNDSRLNRYTIRYRVPDTAPGRDLTDGIRIASFENLPEGAPYSYVLRLFLTIEPRIAIRSATFITLEQECSGFWFWRNCSPGLINATVVMSRP